jgi:DNA mismatch repair protein MutS
MTTTHAAGSASEATQGQANDGSVSILFADPRVMVEKAEQPGCFVDLHLDQIVSAATAGRDEYDLAAFYYQPLQEPDQVRYRQDALDDLQTQPVRATVVAFAEQMRLMRRYLRAAKQSRHDLQRQRWVLEAVTVYCDAAREFADALDRAELHSDGFAAFARYLQALVRSTAFAQLASDARAVRGEVGELEYTINIKGAHVQVDAYTGDDELAPKVQETFARFAQREARDYRWRFKELAGLNHVEEQVLDCIARVFPEPFGRLRDFCRRYAHPFDEPVLRFDREVQFYLGYLQFIEPLIKSGLALSRPELNAGAQVYAEAGFDLSLAVKLAAEGREPVTNDFRLDDPERVLVVTGPNQGGKTTFARMVGQVHYLASLGLPVPAAKASLALPDRVFTHFEREESLSTLRGKFEDELVRIHEILEAATGRSVLVMNESFGSTTLADGLLVGSEIVRQIIDLGSVCLFVSFIDELATLGPETVSMMSTVVAEDPAQRTFRIERKPADGLAYAVALANKHRVGYEDLRQRIAS